MQAGLVMGMLGPWGAGGIRMGTRDTYLVSWTGPQEPARQSKAQSSKESGRPWLDKDKCGSPRRLNQQVGCGPENRDAWSGLVALAAASMGPFHSARLLTRVRQGFRAWASKQEGRGEDSGLT